MRERLTVALEDGVKKKLVEMAGGKRKVGAFLSQLISDAYASQLQQIQDGPVLYARMQAAEANAQSALQQMQGLADEVSEKLDRLTQLETARESR